MNFLSKAIFIALALALMTQFADALPNEKYMKKKESEVQRDPVGFFDFQENTLSNIETIISNYGMIGYDKPNQRGSGYFPRNSRNQYIFGGGIWYGAQKKVPFTDDDGVEGFKLNKLVSVSYDPRTADSWLTPGRVEDGDLTRPNIEKYKVFLSTDYSRNTGKALDPTDADTPNWPVWDTEEEDTLAYSRYFGYYQRDENDRNTEKYPKGPAMISGEDIFTTYHDLDLSQYEGALARRRSQGYPLGLQYEFTIYSWGFGQYQNFFFCLYDVINMSEDTLYDCWLAPIMDVDLARNPFLFAGARNDRVSYWYENTELNMAYQFTDPQFGEQGQGFGYLGFDFLESPTIIRPPLLDDEGNVQVEIIPKDIGNGIIIYDTTIVADEAHPDYKFLRKDSAFYDNSSQLGLVTFKNWNNGEDKEDIETRYNFISDGVTDVDFGPGDKRFMMSTGAFHMRPGDTSRTVVCIMIATPSKTGDADGTRADREGLYTLDLFAQAVYDNNFRAPRPPDQANIKYYQALNNGIRIAWDSTSELSSDREEAGLDFLGYRIDRARRPDLDTFNISQISPNSDFPRGAGPYGWEEVARYELPLPFEQSKRIVNNPNTGSASIDSMYIVGPEYDTNGDIIDTNSIRVMRHGNGVLYHDLGYTFKNTREYAPAVAGIVESSAPWGLYYGDLAADDDFSQQQYDNYGVRYRFDRESKLFDALVGTIELDPARVPYNPLYVDYFSFEVSKEYLENELMPDAIDGATVKYELKEVDIDSVATGIVETSIVDSVYFVNTGRRLIVDGEEKFIVDGALPIDNYKNAMKDSTRVKRALDSLYSYIQAGKVSYNFRDFESSEDVKFNYILPYMNRITNNRTFLDIGDDDRNGVFSSIDDFDDSEKLVNNTPYYYRVLAYDKGDASQPTPSKLNTGIPGINQVETFPEAAEVGQKLEFEIIELDSNRMNGLYDFSFYAVNEDRAKQLFIGDTLELKFDTQWGFNAFEFQVRDGTDETINSTPYIRLATITNLTDDSTMLYQQNITFNPNGCFTAADLATAMYENAAVLAGSEGALLDEFQDTVTKFGIWNNTDFVDFSGRFTTGDFTEQNQCNNRFFMGPAYGTIGFDFKFSLAQQGGQYRASEIELVEGDAETQLYFLDDGDRKTTEGTLNIQPVDTVLSNLTVIRDPEAEESRARRLAFPLYESFNNGPINAIVEFTGSGTETIELEWGRDDDAERTNNTETSTFTVDYLDVKVTNNYVLKPSGENNFEIRNTDEFEHISIDPITTGNIDVPNADTEVIRKAYPDPRNLPSLGRDIDEYIGKFNIASFAHVNIDDITGNLPLFLARSIGRPVSMPDLLDIEETYSGLPQGRYYLSGSDENGNRVDFLNVISIAGAQFVFDNRNIKRRFVSPKNGLLLDRFKDINYTDPVEDFEVGDKVRIATAGGAVGLPFSGASMKVVIKDANEEGNLTDDQMEGIKVVPNPYYITHKNEKTPYDSKLYFTKVPPGSTINIYTVGGNLVQTIQHDPIGADLDRGRVGVNIWDMIMKNGLRVQSQTLIAHIISPDGAETMEKFSVVVGTFNTFD